MLKATWSPLDGQCAALGCAEPRLFADPFCDSHRTTIQQTLSYPATKPVESQTIAEEHDSRAG